MLRELRGSDSVVGITKKLRAIQNQSQTMTSDSTQILALTSSSSRAARKKFAIPREWSQQAIRLGFHILKTFAYFGRS